MRIVNLEQKSPEWLLWRKSGIGGSDAPVLVHGEHFRRTIKTLWKEKLNLQSKAKSNSAMARGNSLEPIARRKYESLVGHKVETICCVHDDHDWLKASLDGWIPSQRVVVEIKAPKREHHEEALYSDRPPAEYQPQLDHLLLVTGGRFAHYVSYSNYFEPSEELAIVKWPRDEKRLAQLLEIETLFWNYVTTNVEPPADLLSLLPAEVFPENFQNSPGVPLTSCV